MVDVKDLAAKAAALNKKGLSVREIAQELHLATETISYLLEYGPEGVPPTDVKLGWRSIGVSGTRTALLSEIFADIMIEEMEKREQEVQVIVGISLNGVPFAVMISEILGIDFAIYRPIGDAGGGGAFSSNYADVNGKKIAIIDDVVSTGQTIRGAINDIKDAGGEPVLVLCMVNKGSSNDIEGVPLRGLIRARSLGGTLLGGGLTKGGFKY